MSAQEASGGALADLTAFQRDCLVEIGKLGAPHGLGIKRELQEYYGEDVNHGRLYPNLDTLVAKGLVEKSERDRRTNEYELTESAQDALNVYAGRIIQGLDSSYLERSDR